MSLVFKKNEKKMLKKVALCPFCLRSNEWPFNLIDFRLHEIGLHHTLNRTWAPTKGHPRYEEHLLALKRFE